MQVRYSLPIDLALQKVKERLIPGPLSIQATADSVQLSVFEPLSRSVHHITGVMLNADVRVRGTLGPAGARWIRGRDGWRAHGGRPQRAVHRDEWPGGLPG